MKIAIYGTGKAAHFLARAIASVGDSQQVELVGVDARDKKELQGFANQYECAILPISAWACELIDLAFLAVSDSAIFQLSTILPEASYHVVHMSGMTSISALEKHRKTGVFWPGFSLIPQNLPSEKNFIIEGSSESVANQLQRFAALIGGHGTVLPYSTRRKLHLAATIMNNFTNSLWAVSQEILGHEDLTNMLLPLAKQSASNLSLQNAWENQTGPAIRHDEPTLAAHLAELEDAALKKMYEAHTAYIQSRNPS